VCGQQFRYTGHVICFGQNTHKVWRQLPLLPEEADILVVKPATAEADHHLNKQFQKRFTVQRAPIKQWLCFLKANHPAYRGVEINEQRLAALPVDESILHQLRTVDESADEWANTDAGASTVANEEEEQRPEDNVQDTVVPDLLSDVGELELLLQEVEVQQRGAMCGVELPTLCATPVSERTDTYVMRSAFPTLFPTGKADFDMPCC
jgi:hypothetical protein